MTATFINKSKGLVNSVDDGRSRKTDLKKSIDRHGSKQGGHGCPAQGAHEDIGQFVVVITRV